MENSEIATVVSNGNKNNNVIETIDAIKNAGFKDVFIQWYNNENWECSQEEQLRYIRKKGLNVIFAHLGYQKINDLWLEGKDGDKLSKSYKEDIRVCKENGIYMVIMHLCKRNKST